MRRVLEVLICASVAIAAISVAYDWLREDQGHIAINIAASTFFAFASLVTFGRWLNVKSRIKILEKGLGSVHSSAIVWEATVLAHMRALKNQGFYGPSHHEMKTLHGYTLLLGLEAESIANSARDIHRWIYETRVALDRDGWSIAEADVPGQQSGDRGVHQEPWQLAAFKNHR